MLKNLSILSMLLISLFNSAFADQFIPPTLDEYKAVLNKKFTADFKKLEKINKAHLGILDIDLLKDTGFTYIKMMILSHTSHLLEVYESGVEPKELYLQKLVAFCWDVRNGINYDNQSDRLEIDLISNALEALAYGDFTLKEVK